MFYDFKCDPDLGGCDTVFEVSVPMSVISGLKPICPNCRAYSSVARVYSSPTVNIPKTLGSLADSNTSKLSADHKEYLSRKHNEHREKLFTGKLPKGVRPYEKNSEGERIPRNN